MDPSLTMSNFALRVNVRMSCHFESKVAFHFGLKIAFLLRNLFQGGGFVINTIDRLDFPVRSM